MEAKKEVKTEFFSNFEIEDQTTIHSESIPKEEQIMEKDNMVANAHASETQTVDIDIDSLAIGYHPRENMGDIESLQGSIKRDGLQEPLAVFILNEGKYGLIDGCRRLEAVRGFGWKTVPCTINKDVDPREAAHLSYVRNAERKGFNPIEIAQHLKSMQEEFGYSLRDLEIKGYGSPASISNRMKLLELPTSVRDKVKNGDLTMAHGLHIVKIPKKNEQEKWAKRIIDDDLTAKRAGIRIKKYLSKDKKVIEKPKVQTPDMDIPGVYIKDSRDMSELPDKSVHLIVSSPPYNVGKEFEKGVSFEEHQEMIQEVLKECNRVLKPGGIMALNVGDIINFKGANGKSAPTQLQLMGHRYQSWLRKYGIFLTDLIIWDKTLIPWRKRPDISYTPDIIHTSYKILCNFESVYIFRKKGEREIPSDDVVLNSRLTKEQWVDWIPGVWKIKPVHHMQGHPCVFPDELPHRLIKMYSYEGDLVLDPWLGSGTTVRVARELNREAVGYEKEPQYKAVIMKKLGIEPDKAENEAAEMMEENIKRITTEDVEVHPRLLRVEEEEEDRETTVECADDYLEIGQVS